MEKTWIEKIDSKYGMFGISIIIVCFAMVIVFALIAIGVWVSYSIKYGWPLMVPFIILAYMVLNTKGTHDG